MVKCTYYFVFLYLEMKSDGRLVWFVAVFFFFSLSYCAQCGRIQVPWIIRFVVHCVLRHNVVCCVVVCYCYCVLLIWSAWSLMSYGRPVTHCNTIASVKRWLPYYYYYYLLHDGMVFCSSRLVCCCWTRARARSPVNAHCGVCICVLYAQMYVTTLYI